MENWEPFITLLNTCGFPLVAIYAYYRGIIVSPRELSTAYRSLEDISHRCERLEAQLDLERAYIRKELDESRRVLLKVVAGDLTPAGVAATLADDVALAEEPVMTRSRLHRREPSQSGKQSVSDFGLR